MVARSFSTKRKSRRYGSSFGSFPLSVKSVNIPSRIMVLYIAHDVALWSWSWHRPWCPSQLAQNVALNVNAHITPDVDPEFSFSQLCMSLNKTFWWINLFLVGVFPLTQRGSGSILRKKVCGGKGRNFGPMIRNKGNFQVPITTAKRWGITNGYY